MTTNQN